MFLLAALLASCTLQPLADHNAPPKLTTIAERSDFHHTARYDDVNAFLKDLPDPRQRTRAIGMYTAVSIGGAAVGLIAGGMLSEWASWRWVLFVNVPIGIFAATLSPRLLVESHADDGTSTFDIPGAATVTAGLDLSSRTKTVGMFYKGYFYDYREDIQNKFSDIARVTRENSEAVAKAFGTSVSTIATFGFGRSAIAQSRSTRSCSSGASSRSTILAPAAFRASLSEV